MSRTPTLTASKRDKLQRMIDRTAKLNEKYHHAQRELNDWCIDHYGQEPGDVDADGIIDALFGGCGAGNSISAESFDKEMLSCIRSQKPSPRI